MRGRVDEGGLKRHQNPRPAALGDEPAIEHGRANPGGRQPHAHSRPPNRGANAAHATCDALVVRPKRSYPAEAPSQANVSVIRTTSKVLFYSDFWDSDIWGGLDHKRGANVSVNPLALVPFGDKAGEHEGVEIGYFLLISLGALSGGVFHPGALLIGIR